MSDALEVVPLGGLGEFGLNCTALRSGRDMILIDAGAGFPSSELGVDSIVPDISFLKENQHELRAILLTHGHDDHAGAVSYIVNELPVPVYGSELTLGLVAGRLEERRLLGSVPLRRMRAREIVEVGPFQIEPLRVTHSFPDSFCLAINTPVGRIIWTGDFKFDQTPIDRRLSDVPRLSDYGESGVVALFSDSTNSELQGLSPSEFSIYEPLRNLFRKAQKKIIVSCFSSAIHRIQVIFDLAAEFGRKVAPLGRSLIANLRTAAELGFLNRPEDLLISAGEVPRFSAETVVVLAAGSQGEPMSALSRLAVNEVRNLQVEEGDLVVLSARVIPGNEKLISNMVNHFCRRGAQVFDSQHAPVHVSGHGYRDDLRLMINLVRPQFFIPVHGEYKQLKTHVRLALDQGMPPQNVRLIENGDVLQVRPDQVDVSGKVTVGRRFIDEGILEEVHDLVLRDRRSLAEDGFVVVVLRMDRFAGELIGDPELISRGFVMAEAAEALMSATRQEVVRIVDETPMEEKRDEELFKEILRKRLKRFLRKQTGKRPMILPVTLGI